METLKEKIARVIKEVVEIVDYDPEWIRLFQKEKQHLLSCLPNNLIKTIEHFGSTAVPNLSAKPIVDILVEVTSLEATREQIVPILEKQGYDYFWRPTLGDDIGPFYAWFIKRNSQGLRTHHLHMIEKDFEHWDSLLFRDYLIEKPYIAKEYQQLKLSLQKEYKNDRVAYTKAKGNFITRITNDAKKYFG